MKYFRLLFITILFACNNHTNFTAAENDVDAGREFVDATLKGNFDKASFYMLQNAENIKLLATMKAKYFALSRQLQTEYKEASIIVNDIAYLSENEVVINYKNSYDKRATKIKLIKKDKHWLADISYSNTGNL